MGITGIILNIWGFSSPVGTHTSLVSKPPTSWNMGMYFLTEMVGANLPTCGYQLHHFHKQVLLSTKIAGIPIFLFTTFRNCDLYSMLELRGWAYIFVALFVVGVAALVLHYHRSNANL
ncbi:hypothetical protein ACJX0J_015831 [Zea mays]